MAVVRCVVQQVPKSFLSSCMPARATVIINLSNISPCDLCARARALGARSRWVWFYYFVVFRWVSLRFFIVSRQAVARSSGGGGNGSGFRVVGSGDRTKPSSSGGVGGVPVAVVEVSVFEPDATLARTRTVRWCSIAEHVHDVNVDYSNVSFFWQIKCPGNKVAPWRTNINSVNLKIWNVQILKTNSDHMSI